MRKLTHTSTGCIVSDTDMKLEYLYVGDYGKEKNIKADFLGYTKRIEYVEHTEVDLSEKMVVTVSSQKGCPMKCNFCDCPNYGFYGNANTWELVSEIISAVALSKVTSGERLNVHFARMGEPSFNFDVISAARAVGMMNLKMRAFEEYHPVVSTMMPRANKKLVEFLHQWANLINNAPWYGGGGLQFSINTLDEEARNAAFNGNSLSLEEIGKIIDDLPKPTGRKYTLNFAVTPKSNLDVALMNKYFDKTKCIVKITPIHETNTAVENDYEIVNDFDVYEKFEVPLVEDGWDVIIFIPSLEEDKERITCGNALLAVE